MATVALDGSWLDVNDALVNFLGYDRTTLLTLDFQSITYPADLEGDLALVGEILAGHIDHYQLTKRYLRPGGETVWALLSVNLIRDDFNDDPLYFIVQIVDIDAQHRLEVQFARMQEERQAAADRERGALRHLVDLHADVATLDSEESALRAVVEAALTVVPHADGAVIELEETSSEEGPPTPVLRYRSVSGTLSGQLGQSVRRDASLSGQALSSRELLHAADTETDPRVDLAACRRTGIRSMLVAPLLAGDDALGVLKVASARPHAFDTVDETALYLLAHSLTAALRHVRDRELVASALSEARVANAALEIADAFKTDLVGMLAHEIGNPLSVLFGATELALETWGGQGSPQRRYLELMERNSGRIERTIRNVVSLAAAGSGEIVAYPEVVDVYERAAEALAAAGLPTTRVSRPYAGTPQAWVQVEHLDQVLTNLVSNALKYGSTPTLHIESVDAHTVRVACVDYGAGVPPEFVPALFQRFSRSERARKTAKGSGIGLYIVRELVRAGGGDITYEPTPGGGATFIVELPAAPDDTSAPT